jgi:hypothetical protein
MICAKSNQNCPRSSGKHGKEIENVNVYRQTKKLQAIIKAHHSFQLKVS